MRISSAGWGDSPPAPACRLVLCRAGIRREPGFDALPYVSAFGREREIPGLPVAAGSRRVSGALPGSVSLCRLHAAARSYNMIDNKVRFD